jgi:hypothetical protein
MKNETANYQGKALVLYFGFHDVSGDVVHDGSGRNNNGKLTKGKTFVAISSAIFPCKQESQLRVLG